MSSLNPPPDISLQILSPSSSSERRITPTWSIAHLKTKLFPITGIPPTSQRLWLQTTLTSTATPSGTPIASESEDTTTLLSYQLSRGHLIYVEDLRPVSARPNLTDTSGADAEREKYSMPAEEYEKLHGTVRSWKKAQGLGRFAEDADRKREELVGAHEATARERGLEVGRRVRVGGEDARRGEIGYLGEVEEIPGAGGWWVGVRLDEPVGRNEGEVGGRKYFDAGKGGKRGVFVRPERVEAGEWPVLDDLEELEEI